MLNKKLKCSSTSEDDVAKDNKKKQQKDMLDKPKELCDAKNDAKKDRLNNTLTSDTAKSTDDESHIKGDSKHNSLPFGKFLSAHQVISRLLKRDNIILDETTKGKCVSCN